MPRGKRVALLIGNGAYKRLGPLDNPKNDVALMEKVLRDSLGFDVIVGGVGRGIDLDTAGMTKLLNEFGAAAKNADVAIVFYAGHGLVKKGNNQQYLPGIEYKKDTDLLDIQSLPVERIMSKIADLDAKHTLVFLDACREVVRGEGGMRGQVSFSVDPKRTRVLYATAATDYAGDGARGKNSPFTAALAQEIVKPVEWYDVELAVAKAVFDATSGEQEPRPYGTLGSKLYLRGEITVTPGPQLLEIEYWKSIKDSKNPAVFKAYLDDFPKGQYRRLAEINMAQLTPAAPVMPPVAVTHPPAAAPTAAVVVAPVPAALTAPRAGEVFRDCTDCPEMVVIPGGSFTMGSGGSEQALAKAAGLNDEWI